jgi:hypothetical protein
MRAGFLLDVLRPVVDVREFGPWRGRGGEMADIYGVVGHDTVTPYPPQGSWTVQRALELLRDGRSDLRGPLSQVGLDPAGVWWLVADGRSNHNGYGTWGNNALGVEVICGGGLAGREQPWNTAQQESFVKGTAAVLKALRKGPAYCKGHKETDPGRKGDPFKVDMGSIRNRIAQVQFNLNPALRPQPTTTPQENDDMMLLRYKGQVYQWYGGRLVHIPYEDRHLVPYLMNKYGVTIQEVHSLGTIRNLAGYDPGRPAPTNGVWIPA